MRLAASLLLLAACTGDDTPRFDDKGQGVWVEVPGTPALAYRAIWGAAKDDVFAVGGGAAHFDGHAWTVAELPAAEYRAIWGRSRDQIWIGGDDILLARSLAGWQPQLVFDHDHPITEFSVLAIAGDDRGEYAVLRTGGQLLLVINRGSAWETPYWRSGSALPFAARPSLNANHGGLVLAGNGTLTDVVITEDLGVPLWEARRQFDDTADGVAVVGGTRDGYVAAGPDRLVFQFPLEDALVIPEERVLAVARDPRGVFVARGQAFVVGSPIELAARARTSAAFATSPIEACDVDGCRLERIAEDRDLPLQAVWGDGNGGGIAVGEGWIVHRTSCGALSCELR